MPTTTSPILPASWAEVLDSVQQALTQAEAEVARSAQLLEASLTADAEPQPEAGWPLGLAQLDEQFRRLQACMAEADRTVAAMEAVLLDREAAVRRWLTAAEAVRRNLVNGVNPSV